MMIIQTVTALFVVFSVTAGWDIDCTTMDISSSVDPKPSKTFPHHLNCTRINDREIIAILTASTHFTGLMIQVHLNGTAVGTFYTRATPSNSNAVGLNYEVSCPAREAQLSVDETAKASATAEWIMLDRMADLSGKLECVVTVIETEDRRWVKVGVPAVSSADGAVTETNSDSHSQLSSNIDVGSNNQQPTVKVAEATEPTVIVAVHTEPTPQVIENTESLAVEFVEPVKEAMDSENPPSLGELTFVPPVNEATVTVLPAPQPTHPTESENESANRDRVAAQNIQQSDSRQPIAESNDPPALSTEPKVQNSQPPVRNSQPPARNSQPPARNSQPPARNSQSGSTKRGSISIEGNIFPEHCQDKTNRLRVPIPNTGCGSYLTVVNGRARSLHGCSFGMCMDSTTCTCKACNVDSCPERSVGTMSISFYDNTGKEGGRVTITSSRRDGENAGYTTSTDITGITNPSNIAAVEEERQPDRGNDGASRGSGLSYRGGSVLSRLRAMLNNFQN